MVASTVALGDFIARYFGSSHPDVWAIVFVVALTFAYTFASHYFGTTLSDKSIVTISSDNNEVMAGYFEAKNASKNVP